MKSINFILPKLYEQQRDLPQTVNIILKHLTPLKKCGFNIEQHMNFLIDKDGPRWAKLFHKHLHKYQIKSVIHLHHAKLFDCKPIIKKMALQSGRFECYQLVDENFKNLLTSEEMGENFRPELHTEVFSTFLRTNKFSFDVRQILKVIDTSLVLNS